MNSDNKLDKRTEYSDSKVNLCGHEFQLYGDPNQRCRSSSYVKTPITQDNMKKLVEAIYLNLPVILSGPAGIGKSHTLYQLAYDLCWNHMLVELNIDDQIDNKTLFGSYVCSEVPGDLIWQPVIVTKAALDGAWLIIEDIDKVPLDIIISLLPLLEKRKLPTPERGPGSEVDIDSRFRIIGIMSTKQEQSQFDSSNYILPNMKHFTFLWHIIVLSTPSREETEQILIARFPSLIPVVVKTLMQTYDVFQSASTVDSSDKIYVRLQYFQKRFSFKELVRISNRIEKNISSDFNRLSNFLTENQRVRIVQEIIDVFAASCRDTDLFIMLANIIGECWDLTPSQIQLFIVESQPQLIQSSSLISIGQVQFEKPVLINENKYDISNNLSISQTFAYTMHDLRLLQRVAGCVNMNEPVLLVGETGSGKTTSVQQLAYILKKKLIVQNLSLSTDTSDLLGGYKPVTIRQLILPLYEDFINLFQISFSNQKNDEYLQIVSQIFHKQKWKKLIQAFQKACGSYIDKLKQENISSGLIQLKDRWDVFSKKIRRFEFNLTRINQGFAFSLVDGLLLQAIKKGYWLLLDEINLASSETLQSLISVLDGKEKVVLLGSGSTEIITRHPNFRIFGAMNPPTDVGKRELPYSIRSRFTEIYSSEMLNSQDLSNVVSQYMVDIISTPISDIVSVYLGCRATSELNGTVHLADGAGQKPHYSLRSLARSLKAAKSFLSIGIKPINRALFEGFLLNFQTVLALDSGRKYMWTYLRDSFSVASEKDLNSPPTRPGGKKSQADDWVLVKPFWLKAGPLKIIDWAEKSSHGTARFVLTNTVEMYIRELAAGISSNCAPILLQGPTSVGKTTMIEYLAARTGHKCLRINNHEHTDVQEYIGGYFTNHQGHLEFRDGLLVEALKKGYWIIL